MLITRSIFFKSTLKKNFFNILFLVISFFNCHSQIAISKPVLGFSEACPSPSFNNFSLTFSFSPASNLNTGNVFNVELSNSLGDFTNPTLLTSSTATSSIISVSFAMPTTVSGTNYKIRIKSTSPAATSPNSDSFAANYAIFTMPFTINNNNSNQSFCENSGYLLSVDAGTNSPLQYPQLVYKWYKNGIPIIGEVSSSLNVTSEGSYYVQVDYGTCNNNAYSNAVSLYAIPTPELVIASETGETEFCETDWLTLITSNISSTNSYQWYLNNVSIPNATNSSYIATEAGDYHLKIQTPNCALESNVITITTIDTSSFTTNPNADAEIEMVEGESITITASGADSYEWFVGNSVVGTSNTYTTNQLGAIQLTATVNNCNVVKNFMVVAKDVALTSTIPNTITPNNDGINDKWILPDEYVEKDDVEVVIFTAWNKEVFRAKNYSNGTSLESLVNNNSVYYYKILKNNSIVAKGTLSIVIK